MSAVMEQEFFAPANESALDLLLNAHEKERARIQAFAAYMSADKTRATAKWFHEGCELEDHRAYFPEPERIYRLEPALAALNAHYWQKAMALTDVMDYMPAKKRDAWNEQIRTHKTPEFSAETVYSTMQTLLSQRMDFLAEMVDGIFQRLSGEHVTNRPEGFYKRMILRWAYNEYGHSGRDQGYVHDLRAVISKLRGMEVIPNYYSTRPIMDHCRLYHGEWHEVDGGALRIKAFKKGTAHLEVHPDMAWRLNQILAHLHPQAIPSSQRRPQPKQRKTHTLMERPIPNAARAVISGGDIRKNEWTPHYCSKGDKHVMREVGSVMEALGGVKTTLGYQFDYDPREIIGTVVASGVIPEQRSHQFYATPEDIARRMVELADVQAGHLCLEPSAGQGAIAELLPDPVCVEVSPLHCDILEAKSFEVRRGDFLEMTDLPMFDRIVMNPPYSGGRAFEHVSHALNLLKPGGRLVALLPTTVRINGATYSEPLGFPGVSIDVRIVEVTKQ